MKYMVKKIVRVLIKQHHAWLHLEYVMLIEPLERLFNRKSTS